MLCVQVMFPSIVKGIQASLIKPAAIGAEISLCDENSLESSSIHVVCARQICCTIDAHVQMYSINTCVL